MDIGLNNNDIIEVTFEEVDTNIELNIESIPTNIILETPPDIQVAINEIQGGEGTTNYNLLQNKPLINGVELSGNKTSSDLGVLPDSTTISELKGYPVIPTLNSYLRDDGAFVPIAVGGSASATEYLSNTNSSVAGYKVMSNIVDGGEVIKTITASNSKVYGETYLHELPISTNIIPSGSWTFDYWRMVSNVSGTSSFGVDVFLRTLSGTEYTLFSLVSPDIGDTVLTERMVTYNQSQFTVNPTDRLGVKTFFITTRAAATTISYIIGNGRGWSMRTPLSLKHSELRDLNGDLNVQHLTNAEKTQGALSTGVLNPSPISSNDLSTINKVTTVLDNNLIKILTDLSSTTKTLSLLHNNDVRLGSLNSLTISSLPSGSFTAALSFTSGSIATTFTYPAGVKWLGADSASGLFIPTTNKRYDIVFWFDGVNINAVVGGIV